MKSKSEIAIMREAGRIVAETIEVLREQARPGVSTAELDALAHAFIVEHDAVPAFKGYRGFPASICTSINDEVVHGIPSKSRVLKEGDILSLDVGAIFKGFVGDGAVSLPIGKVSEAARRLLAGTEGALWAGIKQARAGNHLEDISAAIQDHAQALGYSVVREYVGHGVGRAMHEEPQIPNYRQGKRGPKLSPGMTLAIEPMINEGGWETWTQSDRWTVVTRDGKLSAHFEHTVAVTEDEPEILTRR